MRIPLLCALLLFGVGRAGEKEDNADALSAAGEADGVSADVEAMAPEADEGETNGENWMDRSNQWVTEALYQQVYRFDSMFYGQNQARREDPRSRFRLRLFGITNLEDPGDLSFGRNGSASIRLPGLKDRFRLVLDSEDLGRFPNAGPEDRSDRPQLALRRVGSRLDADVGAKLKTPPNAFVRFNFGRNWEIGEWDFGLSQRFFYDTQEGFGEVTSFAQHRWMGRHWMFGHRTSALWSESTEGVEWQDTLAFYRILSLIESEKHGRFVGTGDLASAVGLRLGVSGYHNGSGVVEAYNVSLIYRSPLFERDFVYLEVVPEVEWRDEDEWDPIYTLRVGLDILFWRDRRVTAPAATR